jgi:hypothetical protein
MSTEQISQTICHEATPTSNSDYSSNSISEIANNVDSIFTKILSKSLKSIDEEFIYEIEKVTNKIEILKSVINQLRYLRVQFLGLINSNKLKNLCSSSDLTKNSEEI